MYYSEVIIDGCYGPGAGRDLPGNNFMMSGNEWDELTFCSIQFLHHVDTIVYSLLLNKTPKGSHCPDAADCKWEDVRSTSLAQMALVRSHRPSHTPPETGGLKLGFSH